MIELVPLIFATAFLQQTTAPPSEAVRPGQGVRAPVLLHSQWALDSFTVAARAGAAFISNPRVIKSGQVRRYGGLWIWFEMAAPRFEAWNAPPALSDRLRNGYGGIHVWSFAATAAGQGISVFCTVVHRAGRRTPISRSRFGGRGSSSARS